MDGNVDQHHAFYPGLKAWVNYTTDCKKGDQKFDATHFIKLIDEFATVLVTHLGEEIPTLLALDIYDIAGVKKAWNKFESWIQSTADRVNLLLQAWSKWLLTRVVLYLPNGNGKS